MTEDKGKFFDDGLYERNIIDTIIYFSKMSNHVLPVVLIFFILEPKYTVIYIL